VPFFPDLTRSRLFTFFFFCSLFLFPISFPRVSPTCALLQAFFLAIFPLSKTYVPFFAPDSPLSISTTHPPPSTTLFPARAFPCFPTNPSFCFVRVFRSATMSVLAIRRQNTPFPFLPPPFLFHPPDFVIPRLSRLGTILYTVVFFFFPPPVPLAPSCLTPRLLPDFLAWSLVFP